MLLATLAQAAGAHAAGADVVVERPPTGDGRLIQSSWVDPDGSDADIFSYDSFICPGDATITEVRWRGGYLYNAMYGKAFDFRFTFYETNITGYEPLCGNPVIDETIYIDDMWSGANCHETYAGTFNGVPMYDYSYVLKRPFQAAAGVKYWLKIEASQPTVPDWAIAMSTSDDVSYFRFIGAMFQHVSGDIAVTMLGTMAQCYPDFTGDGTLDLFDFLAYVNAFNAGDPGAECNGDGSLDLFDFLCFVNAFNAGC
jgi:hypothetical protein